MQKLDAADTKRWQQQKTQSNEAETPEPAKKRTPHQYAAGHGIEPGKHCRSRRRDARHGFEESFGKADWQCRKKERQGTEQGGCQPDGDNQQKAQARGEADLGVTRGQAYQPTEDTRKNRRLNKNGPITITDMNIDQCRDKHGRSHDQAKPRANVDDGAKNGVNLRIAFLTFQAS